MKLTLEQIQSITKGADRVILDNGAFRFLRFTEAQVKAYEETGKADFYRKTFATAGVRFAFRTTSRRFSFDFRLGYGSSRAYAWFDCFINGALEHHFGVDGGSMKGGNVNLALPEGETEVELYFPWSAAATLTNVELDDDATLVPVSRKYKMISFGDSITHGYDAIYPSLSYASQLAQNLDADALNKGIGGDIFFPELLKEKDNIDPDFITVAYGTNDWSSKAPRETFVQHCTDFYTRLSAMYPNAKIFAIAPIWRNDWTRTNSGFGVPVTAVREEIREICKDLPNVTVLDGFNFVPHRKEFFADLYLHPNDFGFCLYAKALYNEIVKHL